MALFFIGLIATRIFSGLQGLLIAGSGFRERNSEVATAVKVAEYASMACLI